MELQLPSPPAYVSHDPADLHLPAVPRGEMSPPHAKADFTLPDLRTILAPEFSDATLSPSSRTFSGDNTASPSVRSLPPMDPGPSYASVGRRSTESVVMSPSESGSVMSLDEKSTRPISVSMDDPDERTAAEALSGLGNPGIYMRANLDRHLLIKSQTLRDHPLLGRSHKQAQAHFLHKSIPNLSYNSSPKRIHGSVVQSTAHSLRIP